MFLVGFWRLWFVLGLLLGSYLSPFNSIKMTCASRHTYSASTRAKKTTQPEKQARFVALADAASRTASQKESELRTIYNLPADHSLVSPAQNKRERYEPSYNTENKNPKTTTNPTADGSAGLGVLSESLAWKHDIASRSPSAHPHCRTGQ